MARTGRVEIVPSLGITHVLRREGLAHLTFQMERYRHLEGALRALADDGVNLVFVKRTLSRASVAVDLSQQQKAMEILRQQGMEVAVSAPCAVICVVGSNMRYTAGVMWRILSRLHQAQVRVLNSSDSFNSVSCLVAQESVDTAARVLSEEFGVAEGKDKSPLDPW